MSSKKKITGFGFIPEESEHHFLINVLSKEVVIAEQFEYNPDASLVELSYKIGRQNNDIKVILHRKKWDLIADDIKAEFNRRLRDNNLPAGKWSANRNYTNRLFGKELILLCWAVEEAEATVIPIAVQNWLGLKPEERWWLYTMTNAATGHAIYDKNIGWRKAIRYALTENPVSMVPKAKLLDNLDGTSLFELEDPDAKKWGSDKEKKINTVRKNKQ